MDNSLAAHGGDDFMELPGQSHRARGIQLHVPISKRAELEPDGKYVVDPSRLRTEVRRRPRVVWALEGMQITEQVEHAPWECGLRVDRPLMTKLLIEPAGGVRHHAMDRS